MVQTIIGHALEREELRDEVLVQCMRQITNNPVQESAERLWLLLCLCIVAFQPTKLLYKYFTSFLRKNLNQGGRAAQYVQWCLDNCKNTKVTVREHPPSSVEIAVSVLYILQPLLRVFIYSSTYHRIDNFKPTHF